MDYYLVKSLEFVWDFQVIYIQSLTGDINKQLLVRDIRNCHELRRSSNSDILRIHYYYAVTTWTGEPIIAEPDKAEDLRWFNLKDLPYEQMTSDVCVAFQATFSGRAFSIDGFAEHDDTGMIWLAKQAV